VSGLVEGYLGTSPFCQVLGSSIPLSDECCPCAMCVRVQSAESNAFAVKVSGRACTDEAESLCWACAAAASNSLYIDYAMY
jgi:hypothetical protein